MAKFQKNIPQTTHLVSMIESVPPQRICQQDKHTRHVSLGGALLFP